jgi:hypothetical protein
MNRLRWVVVLLLVAVSPVLALAAEVAVEPVWYGDVQLWEIVASLVVFVWGVAKVRYKLGERMGKQVTEFLEMGVQHVYDTFVREAKAKNPKGKLTASQVKEARTKAFEAAKSFAREKGVDLAKKVAAERLPVLITGIVNRIKNRKK